MELLRYFEKGVLFMKILEKAFTLAEVILVIAIVGVVAILTIANATNEGDEAERVAQLRRTQHILEQAMAQAIDEKGAIRYWQKVDDTKIQAIHDNFIKKMKLSRDCEMTGTQCWKDGDIRANENTGYMKAILSNGASIAVEDDYNMSIYVDVNGPNKGNSTIGVDIFQFIVRDVIYGGSIKAAGFDLETTAEFRQECGNNRSYCTAWVIKNGNMDYLKCLGELSWTGENGKTTCSK